MKATGFSVRATALRCRFLHSVSALVLVGLSSSAALAQSAPAPFEPSTTVSFEGSVLFNEGGTAFGGTEAQAFLGDLAPLGPGSDGMGFGLSIGRTIDPNWDWRFGAHIASLGDATSSDVDDDAIAESRFAFQYLDAELGYRPELGLPFDGRLFAGGRVLHAESTIAYGYDDPGSDKIGNYGGDSDIWAAGPRLGAEASIPLGDTPFSFNISAAGSALFTGSEQNYDYLRMNGASLAGSGSASRSVDSPLWNAEASASLAYRLGPALSVEVGYRAQQWWDLAPSLDGATDDGSVTLGSTDLLVHSGFLRLTATVP